MSQPHPITLQDPIHQQIDEHVKHRKLRPEDRPWRDKAERIIGVIAKTCYERAQRDRRGKKYKTYHPYTLPPVVDELVQALAFNDEARAKDIFHRISKLGENA